MAKKFNVLRSAMSLEESREWAQVKADQMLSEISRNEMGEVQSIAQANNPILPNHT